MINMVVTNAHKKAEELIHKISILGDIGEGSRLTINYAIHIDKPFVETVLADNDDPLCPKEILKDKLPTIGAAGVIAVGLSEHLELKEQAFFIAGFQEAIKYLKSINQ